MVADMRHPTDGNAIAADAHCDQPDEIGTEDCDICGRYPEPDEGMPRGYKPKPCKGVMHYDDVEGCTCHISPPCGACVNNPVTCDICGEIGD